MSTKVCTKCGEEKNIDLFPKAKWHLSTGEITFYYRKKCIKCCSSEKPKYKRNNTLDSETRRIYRKSNPDKSKELSRSNSKRYKEQLGIGYIKHRLSMQGLPASTEIIKLKTQQLQLKRTIKQLKNEVF